MRNKEIEKYKSLKPLKMNKYGMNKIKSKVIPEGVFVNFL